MAKIYRVPTNTWRKEFYATDKGRPSLKAINESIDRGELPGSFIAGKWTIYCNHVYEPLWELLNAKSVQPTKVTNPIAAKILAEWKAEHVAT